MEFILTPEKSIEISLNLRIPMWSTQATAMENEEEITNIKSGSYLSISRICKSNDQISIELDVRVN